MRSASLLGGSLILALLISVADAGTTAQDGSTQKPELTGAWALNRDLSDKPPVPGPDGAGADAGRRGGGGAFGGGGGRGRAGGPGGQRPNVEDMQAMRQLMEPPTRLTITQTSSDVTITDGDGRSRKFSTNGKSEKHQLGNRTVDTKTQWDGARLVKQTSLGGMKATETYTLMTDRRRLTVNVKLEAPPMNGVMNWVYDDASER